MKLHCIAALLAVHLIGMAARGETKIALPTDGYYRPGRFIPVYVDSDVEVTLAADGAVTTVIKQPIPHRVEAVLILTASATELRWSDADGRSGVVDLQPLTARQRLVGFDRTDDSAAALFPNEETIAVRIGNPLVGDMQTWEALDAVVMDQSALDHLLSPEHLNVLIAAGTIVAVRSQERPDDRPWSQTGNLWVLEADISGPASAGYSEAAYQPTWGWSPGQSQTLRHQIILAAVVFSLLASGAALLGRRAALIALAIVVGGALAGVYAWRKTIPPLAEARGAVRIISANLAQTDQWLYQRGIETSEWSVTIEPNAIVRPILLGPDHLASLQLVVEDAADKRFRYTLPVGGRVAFVSRRIEFVSPDETIARDGSSRLDELVGQLYLAPGISVKGIINEGDWGTVVLEK